MELFADFIVSTMLCTCYRISANNLLIFLTNLFI